ncbi:MAG: benzoate-CoA ligase family protein [Chloroflexi bacterium OHK40]
MVVIPERYNASELIDRNLERGRAAKVAIVCGDEQLSYGELAARINCFGNALRGLGVRREERVLLALLDTPAFPTAFLGAMRIGAVPIPTNTLLAADEYRYMLADSYARVAVVDAALLPTLRDALTGLREPPLLIVANGPADDGYDLAALLADADERLDPCDTHRDDMAFWLYSSGSTGRPKGAVHRHRDMVYTCETYARHVLQIAEDDVTFSASKLFHAYGLGNNLSFPYWAGATTVLFPGRPTPLAVLETAQRTRPSLFFSVPTLYNAILNTPGAEHYDLSSVRLCVSAAEALPPEVWRRWKERFGLTILDGIGSTEMLHIFLSNTPERLRPGSSGVPVPGYDARLVGLDGQPVASGEPGALHVRGGSAASHYWHNDEKTRQTMIGEWMVTGDYYRVDEDGFYWYEGRIDDMIKVGGNWVSPIDIENALTEHPAVLEPAVIGVPIDGLTRIRAFVILREGHAASDALAVELQEWCKARLRRYQYPHLVSFVAELPKTVTGKIQRFKLRQQHETELAAAVGVQG